ncbi:hypothetical protein HDV02_004067, partial [Globomyces sp. JEL0801]
MFGTNATRIDLDQSLVYRGNTRRATPVSTLSSICPWLAWLQVNATTHHQVSLQALDELYQNKKLFNSAATFKKYLQFKEPVAFDLEYALKNNKPDIGKVLLKDCRSDPSAVDYKAIGIAISNGHTEIIKIFLQDERVIRSGSEAILLSSSVGHTEVVKRLLQDERVDPSAHDNAAIKYACGNGQTEIVKMLLQDERVDPSASDNYSIKISSNNGHTEIVQMLLQDERVDPSTYNNYAIRRASENGHTEIVR